MYSQKFYVLATAWIDLSLSLSERAGTPSYVALSDWFYKREGVSLLRRTNWIFE